MREKEKMSIDGFEFERESSIASDLENFNYFLSDKFNEFGIKDYISRRHPEIYPNHLGLQSDKDYNLEIAEWGFSHFSSGDGSFERGWYSDKLNHPEKIEAYKADILDYYRQNEPDFYDFIKTRIK